MLTTMMLALISTTLMMKSKKYWENMVTSIMMMNMMFIMTLPMNNYIFLLSSNSMLDSMSTTLMVLTMWISSLMTSSSYKIKMKQKMFMLTNMILLISLIKLFSTNNMILFYILFELSIIPILLLIMMWGHQPERITASFYIIMYTITASLPLLIMLLIMMKVNNHSNMSYMYHMLPMMLNNSMSSLMLIAAFLVKLPLFSLHLWLPKAHVEAPLAGSMILASILLKLGSYGLFRMNKMMPNQPSNISNMVLSIAVIGTLITNMMCLRQTDLKSLIAYSSVGHMGLMIIGLMSNSKLGLYGGLLMMLTHGLTSSCLFLLTNMMYEKMNSRNIMLMSGTLLSAPMMSAMWMITSALNMSLPPSLSIISEIIIMMSSLMISKLIMMLLMMASFTTATYSLYMYTMINHGNQLTSTNSMLQPNSMILTNWLAHSWPILMLLTMPMKLMQWC